MAAVKRSYPKPGQLSRLVGEVNNPATRNAAFRELLELKRGTIRREGHRHHISHQAIRIGLFEQLKRPGLIPSMALSVSLAAQGIARKQRHQKRKKTLRKAEKDVMSHAKNWSIDKNALANRDSADRFFHSALVEMQKKFPGRNVQADLRYLRAWLYGEPIEQIRLQNKVSRIRVHEQIARALNAIRESPELQQILKEEFWEK